jgi:OOP family OmpA-OmpF porin
MSTILRIAVACISLATLSASAGYLTDGTGQVVRNSYGECVHTGFWTPDQAIIGCDGKVAEVVVVETEFAAVEPAPPQIRQVTLDTDTFFAFDRAELRPVARERLEVLLGALEGYDDLVAVRIVGHADHSGEASYNRVLALERAAAVKRYLVDQGRLDPDRVELISRGESDPRVDCSGMRGQDLVECLAPNRRVEIDVRAAELR